MAIKTYSGYSTAIPVWHLDAGWNCHSCPWTKFMSYFWVPYKISLQGISFIIQVRQQTGIFLRKCTFHAHYHQHANGAIEWMNGWFTQQLKKEYQDSLLVDWYPHLTRAVWLLNNALQCKGNMALQCILDTELGWSRGGVGRYVLRLCLQNPNLSIPITWSVRLWGGLQFHCHNTQDMASRL